MVSRMSTVDMKDADIPTIFNPKRVRAPSVVVTDEENSRSFPNGPFSSISNVQHSDSGEFGFHLILLSPVHSIIINLFFFIVTTNASTHEPTQTTTTQNGVLRRLTSCKNSCCSVPAKKVEINLQYLTNYG